jgi:hypothetical protein
VSRAAVKRVLTKPALGKQTLAERTPGEWKCEGGRDEVRRDQRAPRTRRPGRAPVGSPCSNVTVPAFRVAT